MQDRSKRTAFAAAWLGAALLAVAPAAAQEGRRDNGRDRGMERIGRDAFEQGYRAGRDEERRAYEFGVAWNDTRQSEAYESLERAAAELRRAMVLMRRAPSLPRVNGALVQAREAFESTQNAITWLPPSVGRGVERRYERRSGRGIGAERASGGWAS
ncbi:MAG TPA: hypothetical protein VGN83_23090 [Falsiroseomonas sp.]|jgi:hypothetical protein|nr:hypothetical protein [Falsiroseomonas sp.]